MLLEADRVYHWKHGWIPLDHTSASDVKRLEHLSMGQRRQYATLRVAGKSHDEAYDSVTHGGTKVSVPGRGPVPDSAPASHKNAPSASSTPPEWGGSKASVDPKGQAALRSKLDGMEKTPQDRYMAHMTDDQFARDPNAAMIESRGTSMSAGSLVRMHGTDGECHWNTSKLFEQGKIDGIVIGYAFTPGVGWIQHTWGVKNGKIVETNESAHATRYFGVQLSPTEAASFAKWTREHPPGGGVVRRA